MPPEEIGKVSEKLGYLTAKVEELVKKIDRIERILVGNGFGGLLGRVAALAATVTILMVLIMKHL